MDGIREPKMSLDGKVFVKTAHLERANMSVL